MTAAPHPGSRVIVTGLLALSQAGAWAQTGGVSTQANSGGLVIPAADVLPQGTLVVTSGNYQEPQLGSYATQENFSFGIGLLPYVELFGRYTNYINPPPEGSILVNGIRDLSANLKAQLPLPWAGGPRLAVGANDVAGGAVNFSSRYVVASQQLGPLDASLGYAKSGSSQNTFNGLFGGVALRLGDSGATALAEHDGQQQHAGLRWQSAPLPALGRASLVGTLQRSFGAVTPAGASADRTKLALSLLLPLGDNQARLARYQPTTSQALAVLGAASPQPPAPGMVPTSDDQLTRLRSALQSAGLERVRVGLRQGILGTLLVIEYENHRYAHNEADALGLVLGLGAELAPAGTQRVHAITLKDNLLVYETSVGVAAYRAFLRDGPISQARDSLDLARLPASPSAPTRWLEAPASPASALRVVLKPDLNYALGTEVGSFDYALAANLQATAPLWPGAQAFGNVILPLVHSHNMDDDAIFGASQQRSGLKTLALRQTLPLGRHILASVAAGRFHYDTLGLQAEALAYLPDTDHLLRLRGAAYQQPPSGLAGASQAFGASYRHLLSHSLWLEAGAHQFTDGSRGPSLEGTRWFGDVSVQIYYRKGGERQFAGLQISLPLTPRQGIAQGPVVLAGASQYSQGIRTRITTATEPANLVQADAVRIVPVDTNLEVDTLNAGRVSQDYVSAQLPRLREAFFSYGRALLPEPAPAAPLPKSN
jgi:hypothetical protein